MPDVNRQFLGMERIEIKHFDLEFEKRIETTEAFIELNDTYFRYRSCHDSEHPKDKSDLLQGWEAQYHNFDTRIKREAFISVEWYWNDKQDYYEIQMEATGYPTSIILYFNDEKEMLRVFEIIFHWVFKTSQN